MPLGTGAFDDMFSRELTPEEVQQAVLAFNKLKEAQASLAGFIGGDEGRAKALEEIRSLEAKEELTSIEKDLLIHLRELVRTGVPAPSHVYVEELLLKKVGPEKFKKIQMKRADHVRELELLKQTNDELQRQVELLSGHVKKTPAEDVSSPLPPVSSFVAGEFERNGVSGTRRSPGTYLVEVDRIGKVTHAYEITPKTKQTPEAAARAAVEALVQAGRTQEKQTLWARFLSFLGL